MSDKPLTKKDREFLATIGVSANGHAAPKPAPEDGPTYSPETASENNPIFSASDMQSRWEKLKAQGKVPPLADLLKAMQKDRDA